MDRGSVRIAAMGTDRVALEETYRDHLAYRAVFEARGDRVPPMSPSAERYSKVIWYLATLGRLNHFDEVVRNLHERFFSEMGRLGLRVSEWGRDDSWVRWDLAKQLYFFLDAEATADPHYRIANPDLTNPLTDEQLLDEIVSRHVGWEVQSAEAQAPAPERSSWALAELGRSIRA